MHQRIDNLWRWLQLFLPGFIICVAICVLLLRLSLFFINDYKDHFAAWLSEYLHTPVTIQHIQAELRGFGFAVDLQGLKLGDTDKPIQLEHGLLELDYRGFRLNLDRLHLSLIRNLHGRFELQGLPLFNQTDTSAELPMQRLLLRNAILDWQDQLEQGPIIQLTGLDLALTQSADQIQLRGRFDNALGQLDFAADMQTGFTTGQTYLHWRGLPLAELAQTYLPAQYPVTSGKWDIELWQQWQEGSPKTNQAYLQAHDLRLEDQSEAYRISARLNLHQLADDRWHLNLAAAHWDVHSLAGLLAHQLDPTGATMLAGLNPQGRLHQPRLQMELDDSGKLQDWLLNTAFDLSIEPWRKIPGVRGLHGELAMQPDRANLHLAATDTRLDSRLLCKPIALKKFSGTFHAVADTPDHWRIYSQNLALETADFTSRAELRLMLDADRPPHLDIQAYVPGISASLIGDYVPGKLVKPVLTEWLDRALQTGHIDQIRLLLSGPLDTFPYHETRNGTFEVAAEANRIKLNYQRGWPVLDVERGKLRFYQNSLDAELLTGGLYNSQATGQAHIVSLVPTSALEVTGRARGPLQDVLSLVQEEPLKDRLGTVAKLIRFEGEADSALNLSIPVVSGRSELDVQGKIRFDNNRLHLQSMDLMASEIQGELRLNQTELHAKGIRAKSLGTPIRIDVQPKAGNSQMNITGRIKPAVLKQFSNDFPLDFIKGAAQTRLTLNLPGLQATKRKTDTSLKIQSDLRGLRIDLPEPFGKTAQTRRPLQLDMVLSKPKAPVRLIYADALQALFSPDGQRADVRYRTGKPLLPEHGYRLHAKFDQLDLADWQSFMQNQSASQAKSPPWYLQIESDQLHYKGLHVNDALLSVEQEPTGLRGQIDSRQIQGNFFYPRNKPEPVSVHLDKADIEWHKSSGRKPLPTDFGPDPGNLPAIRLICDDLRVNQMPFGQLVLNSAKKSDGLAINQLIVAGPHISLNAQGDWLQRGARPVTQLQGKFHANDLGYFLHEMGFQRNLHDADTNLLFDLNWPGHPFQVRKETLAGSADLLIGPGRLAELEPGLVKVVGLLNLDVLSRRLQLDFTDLVQKGYSFDKIEGHFKLAGGNATTRDLHIPGPTSHIQIGGRIGFIERDFDSLVYVTPELDGTLLLTGVLTGGPVVGLGALLAQQLLNDEVNDFSRFEYGVTGSWDDPQLKPLQAGVLSDLINSISGDSGEDKTPRQHDMIESDKTARRGFIHRLLENIPSDEADDSSTDDHLFEELD